MRFFSYSTAAKGLMLTATCTTSMLVLLAPDSLAGRSTEHAGIVADALAVMALIGALVGWADVVYHDVMGKLIWPTMDTGLRHKVCVMLYAYLAGLYAILAFAAADPHVETNWIVLWHYAGTAGWGAVLTMAIGLEPRKGEA